MPRKPDGERPMTDAERQARYRAARANGKPIIRTRRPIDHRSRARRWRDAVAELVDLQAQYAAWLDALPNRPSHLIGRKTANSRNEVATRCAVDCCH